MCRQLQTVTGSYGISVYVHYSKAKHNAKTSGLYRACFVVLQFVPDQSKSYDVVISMQPCVVSAALHAVT